MKQMNLPFRQSGGTGRFTGKYPDYAWSDEALQALVTLNLWLHCQAECLSLLGVAGGKGLSDAYSEIASRVDEFIRGGPEVMTKALNDASHKAQAFNTLLNLK